MPGLKIIFGQQIYLKWNHDLFLIAASIICVKYLKDKKALEVLYCFIEIVN